MIKAHEIWRRLKPWRHQICNFYPVMFDAFNISLKAAQVPHHYLRACCEQILFLVTPACLSVCLSTQNLKNYSSEIDVTWKNMSHGETLEVVESWWHLTLTFDLESYLRIFLIQAIPFEWLYLATSFLVWSYIFRISRSQLSFKDTSSVSRQWKTWQCTTQNSLVRNCSKWLAQNICYNNAQSN